MKELDYRDFDKINRNIIYKFLEKSEEEGDNVSGSLLATMAQFALNFRNYISRHSPDRDWVTPCEIIDCQIESLRGCIIDLNTYKQRLEQGVIRQ